MLAVWEDGSALVSLEGMKRRLFFTALGLAVLVLALAGWTVRGVRFAVAAPSRALG